MTRQMLQQDRLPEKCVPRFILSTYLVAVATLGAIAFNFPAVRTVVRAPEVAFEDLVHVQSSEGSGDYPEPLLARLERPVSTTFRAVLPTIHQRDGAIAQSRHPGVRSEAAITASKYLHLLARFSMFD